MTGGVARDEEEELLLLLLLLELELLPVALLETVVIFRSRLFLGLERDLLRVWRLRSARSEVAGVGSDVPCLIIGLMVVVMKRCESYQRQFVEYN